MLENLQLIKDIKEKFAHDGGAEREHNADPDSLGFGLVHYSLVRTLKPEMALCVGSRYGFIPACIALALKANAKGRLHFVDANYDDGADGFGTAFGGVRYWSQSKENYFQLEGINEVIDMFIERTDTFFPSHPDIKYQYAYLDGNHSYEGVKYDCGETFKRMDAGGIITFHDALIVSDDFGINRYLKELGHHIVIGQPPGLGIIQWLGNT